MVGVTDILNWLHDLPQPAMFAVTGGFVFAECTVGLGYLVPGEAALSVAGATVDTWPRFLLLWAVAIVASFTGDSVGFALGRRIGPELRNTRFIQKHGAKGWDAATGIMERRTLWAVFISRLTPFVRTMAPAVAGASRLPYRRYAPVVLVSGILWCFLFIMAGWAIGDAVKAIDQAGDGGNTGTIVIAAGLVFYIAYRIVRRRARAAAAAVEAEHTARDGTQADSAVLAETGARTEGSVRL